MSPHPPASGSIATPNRRRNLERGNRLTWFEPSGHGLVTRSEILDGRIANSLDPLALLRCQLSASEVEREGEQIESSESGNALSEEEFQARVRNGAIDGLMARTGYGDRESKKGDALELATAATVLKLGVAEVRRSLRLKVNTPGGVSSRLPHAEIDLLFNWNGRLWLVDCKDRMPEEDLVRRLRGALRIPLSDSAQNLLRRIGDEMEISQTKVLKEDLVAISDVGGLLGQVVRVRRHPLPDEVCAYARRNRIEVVQKKEIFEGFRRLLHPERPASSDQLAALERRYTRGQPIRTAVHTAVRRGNLAEPPHRSLPCSNAHRPELEDSRR